MDWPYFEHWYESYKHVLDQTYNLAFYALQFNVKYTNV